MTTADVTIYGAGIFGLSCAWAIQRRGARVQVIDPDGVGAGSSGGIVGALAPHTPENWNQKKQFQLDSLLMAEAFWSEIDAASELSAGYGRLGRVQPVLDVRGLDLARDRIAGAAQFWRGQAEWAIVAAADLDGWHPASPTGLFIQDTLSARLHPRQACHAIAAAITAGGGAIRAEGRPDGLQLWATGAAGLQDLSAALGQMVGNSVKGQAALLDLDRRSGPQLFADGVHIVPHADGTTAIGSTSERAATDPVGTDHQLDELIARARALCPALEDAPVIARWAGLRPRARSRAPMLGHWPGRAGHFIANGGFKIGFGMAPKVAEVMADLILDGIDRIPEPFQVAANLKSQTTSA
ncbi:FAD-binding oxidoreductase [Actibacterium sp. 188UL27-1]|uniref:NAD(P)/FAD-dependent oxidoreductase n=1 Tax=Actibacterium sp. 188UL27-1 TaxID=2786961 RepID=UPI00195DA3C2|nr:FAD-binding oxidoreductase [Actibacterium sp. 188UL27-1]MBM7069368.1 FAD-binding oxidoreductase [Actibacterium sp. 188UL27-1]